MPEKVEVNPQRLRQAGIVVGEVQSRAQEILTRLVDATSGLGSPWGDDKFGAKFASGAAGYVRAESNMIDGAKGLAGALGGYSAGLTAAAKEFASAEERSAGELK
ncbi:WXG100 family type VII secretion target [Nocardia sp. NPDC052566]|uniref:WXG100 family type VII secretion target n=1 Tax=Nocardia sp. NPDC052566 TaxID=3364330 RepID=UPI0037C73A8D